MSVHKLKNTYTKNKVTGFTIIEMVIALLIGSILLAWGIPNYRDLKVRKQVSETANETAYSLSLARAEAIRYGTGVKVQKSGTNWNEGWSLFTLDALGANDQEIYVQDAFDTTLKFTQSGDFTGDIVFNNLGAVSNGMTTQFLIENDTSINNTRPISDSSKIVRVSPSGSSRVQKP